jgi:hypothetical protein
MVSSEDSQTIASRCEVHVSATANRGTAGVLNFEGLGDPNAWWKPDLKDILPSRPRGDYRERTVNLLVRDAVEQPDSVPESILIATPAGDGTAGAFYRDSMIASNELQERFGEMLDDLYVIETSPRAATRKTRFLFPFHTDLPGNFVFSGRYKMFNGMILAFLATPGAGGTAHNEELLDSYYRLFNDEQELSLLDRQALRIARAAAHPDDAAKSARHATAATLIDLYKDKFSLEPLFPEAHNLFQQDMATALRMRSLGRKDRINAVLTVFYLHLALYFWRIGYSLHEQSFAFARFLAGENGAFDDVIVASDRTLEKSPFRAKMLFRVPSARVRSVHEADPCAASFREVNNRRLTLLPVNMSLLAATRKFLGSGLATFGDAAAQLAGDEELRRSFDAACWLAAFSISDQKLTDQQCSDLRSIARNSRRSGFEALSDVLLKGWRSELRRSTTDITAQLMRRGGKGLAATRGKVQYFEAGQDLLLLLAKLVTGEGEAVRYEDFLDRVSLYGLAPQDTSEVQMLAEVLHSLQLLEKYSDTGEAMYVQHFL